MTFHGQLYFFHHTLLFSVFSGLLTLEALPSAKTQRRSMTRLPQSVPLPWWSLLEVPDLWETWNFFRCSVGS